MEGLLPGVLAWAGAVIGLAMLIATFAERGRAPGSCGGKRWRRSASCSRRCSCWRWFVPLRTSVACSAQGDASQAM